MNSKNTRYLILLLLIASCKSIQLPTEKKLAVMPDRFAKINDSNGTAKINWKDFIKDEKLIALVDTALNNNFDVLTAYQNIQIAKANLQYNRGLLQPTVNANLAAGVTKYGDYTQEWAGNRTTEMYRGKIIPQHLPDFLIGFSSSWEADIWGKLKNRKQAAKARYLASEDGKNWLVTNLIAEIANNYYELVALDKQIEILNDNIALQEKSLSLSKLLKEANKSNELAVKQFEAQIINAKATAKELSQDIVAIEGNINILLGRFPQVIQRTSIDLENWAAAKINEGIPAQLLQNRPDIRLAEQELIARRADVKAARTAFYPSLNIGGRFGIQGFSANLLFSIPSLAYGIIGGMTAPLLNKSAIKAEFNTASANQLTALYNYQKTIVVAFTEVYTQVRNMSNLDEIVTLKKQQVNTLDSAILHSDLLFQNNRVNYLEVIAAQTNFLQAQIDLLESCKQQQQLSVNLYKSIGGGN